jgi:four helix bundle protein
LEGRIKKEELRSWSEQGRRSQATNEAVRTPHHAPLRGLAKTTEAHVLGTQLLRSGTSVGVNYREAFRARSKSEFVAKCGDSLRELEESAYWLELLVDAGLMPPAKLQSLRSECDELTAIFVTIIKQARKR